jgi:hypothetical protein
LIGNYLLGIGLGSALLLALWEVTGARWAIRMRRVPEALTALLLLGAVVLGAVFLCYPSLYPWFDKQHNEALSPFQLTWFTRSFFLLRSLIYALLWIISAFLLVRSSRRRYRVDSTLPRRSPGISALFLVIFAVTCWLSSTDWLMSLEPHWSSTIFGVYNFAGIFVSGLAAVTALTIILYWVGPLRSVLTRNNLHDLGTLLFGFSSFWMYIWFSQYLLIWYVNNPEETSYFKHRLQGEWQRWIWLDIGLNWAVPFVVLLFRGAKRNSVILFAVACTVLVGRWVDLYVMVMPPILGGSAP